MKHKTKFITRRSIVGMIGVILAITLALTMVPSVFGASDSSYDMTWPGSDIVIQETINGALWESLPSTLPTGSGVFHAFFRVQASPNERGYNTDGRPLQFDENTSATFTHSYLLIDVPQVKIGGVIYREFQLDINEASSTGYISLDEFQVWTTNDENLLGYDEGSADGSGDGYFPDGTGTGQAKLVYNLDGDGDTWIRMDYLWNTGSGKRDYRVLVPESDFDGKMLTYVVIFTRHGLQGGEWESDDGFEEWGVAVYPATKDGYKFNDINANHVWDGGELGLEGWTIYIDYNGNGVLDAGEPNDLTDSTGYYIITDIELGTWDVREVLQAGWLCSYPYIAPNTGYYESEVFGNGALNSNNFGNYEPRGCLELTKAIDWGDIIGDPANVPDVDFTVTVTGPSYPSGTDLVFHLVDGVVTYDDDDTACLCSLIPGDYYVTEIAPAGWAGAVITNDDPATVAAGDTCGDTAIEVIVTNSPILGCLEIEKAVDLSGVVGPISEIPDVDFVITVTGPSYPSGTDLTFNLVDGVISGAQDLNNIIPGSYTVTETPPAGWSLDSIVTSPATVNAGDACGDVVVTVTNSPILGCLEITKVLDLDEYMFAGNVTLDFTVHVTGPGGFSQDVVFHVVDGVLTNSPQTINNLAVGSYIVTEEDPGIGWDVVIIGSPADVISGETCAQVTVTNTLLIPHTTISITADVYETTPGGNVWLYISDTNDGEVPLTNPSVTLLVGADPPIELVKGDAYWSVGPPTWAISSGTANGDTNDDGIMDVNETWYWAVQVTLYADTDITVNGHGTDPLGNPVDGPTYDTETDTITVEVGGATRTWGFWKTHLWLVQWMFDPAGGNITLPIDLGTWDDVTGDPSPKLIYDVCDYMGLMWAKQASNSDGGKREKIDAARIHTAHQALAAIMNYYMPGGAPLPAGITLASIADTLTNGTEKEIRDLGSALANYNESGDDEALDPSMPPTGKVNNADPQGARLVGDLCETFWDTPEASKGQGKGKNK